ncbi:MAG: signal peptidase I [Aphanizomenon sp.]|jgi:signal peptidase I|nr:MAG: signal peptidase I [Aphanizomenon flos-aquae MDT14a]
MQNQASDKNSSQQSNNSWILELGKTMFLSISLALGIRTFVAEARWIPTGSMEPTLHGVKDQWLADKIIVDKVKYKFANPERGDIVVFLPPQEIPNNPEREAFIKRVIGLPGEKVELREGKVYINNKPLQENVYLSSTVRTFVEACNSGGLQPPFLAQPQTVPPNYYLMLGDNRDNSYDGRCWGLVPRNNIIGRAVVRFWPINRMGSIDKSPAYSSVKP